MASTPENSARTSVKQRGEAARSEGTVEGVIAKQPKQLQLFAGNPQAEMPAGLPLRLTAYLALVD